MNGRVLRLASAATLALLAAAPDAPAQSADRVSYTVAPNEADPGVQGFLRNNVVLFDRPAPQQAPLLVFLPGTRSDPAHVRLFLGTAADAGYRVISLSYDNEPAVMQVCASDPDPACSENLRESRLFGGSGPAPYDTPPDEAIVRRLMKLLQFLDGRHPDEGWRAYLVNGAPDWHRITVAGHSAAFLAKRVAVARVLMLSGPADFVPPSRQPAPWLAIASATPIDRWYGLYHRDEEFVPELQRAYTALGLSLSHIRVVSIALAGLSAGAFAYHVSVVADYLTPRAADGGPAYAADWNFLLGRPR